LAYPDTFGFIPAAFSIDSQVATVRPLDSLQATLTGLDDCLHPDGFIYPPISCTMEYTLGDRTPRKQPRSDRPAPLQGLPATHSLTIATPSPLDEDPRLGVAAFVVHLLGWIYGFRAQFSDWWFDGRVPHKPQCDYHQPTDSQASLVVERSLAAWYGFPPRQRQVATNILYLGNRAASYEMTWERFQAEYMIADALFALAKSAGHIKAKKRIPHAARLDVMCSAFGIPTDSAIVERIITLRNDLLHEALWEERMPGATVSHFSYTAALFLHGISKRVSLSLFGVRGLYVHTAWWRMIVDILHVA